MRWKCRVSLLCHRWQRVPHVRVEVGLRHARNHMPSRSVRQADGLVAASLVSVGREEPRRAPSE